MIKINRENRKNGFFFKLTNVFKLKERGDIKLALRWFVEFALYVELAFSFIQ